MKTTVNYDYAEDGCILETEIDNNEIEVFAYKPYSAGLYQYGEMMIMDNEGEEGGAYY